MRHLLLPPLVCLVSIKALSQSLHSTTNSVWLQNNEAEPVAIILEGFLESLPTNFTGSITRSIW